MTDAKPTSLLVPLADTKTLAVTCFGDRAEMTREIVIPAPSAGAGSYDVCVEGLTTKCDPDSIRVKAAEGCKVTIVEVSFEVHQKVLSAEAPAAPGPGGVDAKRAELHSLIQAAATLEAELSRAKEQRKLIDGFVKGALLPPPPASGPSSTIVIPERPSIARVDELLVFHATRCAASDDDVQRLEQELATARAAVEVATAALSKLQHPAKPSTSSSRDVSVLVQVGEGAAKAGFVLHLTYMVTGASWKPSYDIRVDTSAAKAGGELALSYFGQVTNGCGEDWDGCKLYLSTAKPSHAGCPPAPPRRMLRWEQPQSYPAPRCARRVSCRNSVPQQACMSSNAFMGERQLSCDALECAALAANLDEDEDDDDDLAGVAQSTVAEGGGGTASFAIERVVSIEADSKPHKVTIALLAFEPQLLYFATPSLEAAFYLQVKAKNTSSFPLLASSKVAVFLDGSFVTSTTLRDVSPSEEFTTFLGADAALKLKHQQLARERRAAGHMFSGSSGRQSTTHRFVSKLHNTKAVPCKVTVVEVLPKATEDKIKVELSQPSPKELRDEGTSGDCVMQNKVTNNIVWQLTLPPGGKKELPFEYTVSWPSDKQLDSYDYQGISGPFDER